MKTIKYILFGAMMFAMFLTAVFVYYSVQDTSFEKKENKLTIEFNDKNKLFVLAKAWGITGNHQQITFSQTPIKVPNKTTDYIFYTDEVFYKIEGDSIIVFAAESGISIPSSPFKNIELITNGLKNSDALKDYSENYKDYGLERISTGD